MVFEVEIEGRLCAVAIEPAGREGRFWVAVDGRRTLVDVDRSGTGGLSLLIVQPPAEGEPGAGAARPESQPSGRGQIYDVAVMPSIVAGELTVHVGSAVARARVTAGRHRRRARGVEAHVGPAGPQKVLAPMPGKVVRLLVAQGDSVSARQGLIVVEAMKMENELRSPKAGQVTQIAVTEGASVETGAVLLVVE